MSYGGKAFPPAVAAIVDGAIDAQHGESLVLAR